MARWVRILVWALIGIGGAASPARALHLSPNQLLRKAKSIQAQRRAAAQRDGRRDFTRWRGTLNSSDRKLLDSSPPEVQRLVRSALRGGRAARE
jgi:hypothetical protein